MVNTASENIAELRRRTELTWDQLAQIFGVTRRAIHVWGSGKKLAGEHAQKLGRVCAVIRRIERGSPEENTAVLLSPVNGGLLVIDLLAQGRYDEAVWHAGKLPHAAPPLHAQGEAVPSRLPLGWPDAYIATVPDNIHKEPGITRPARTARARSRG